MSDRLPLPLDETADILAKLDLDVNDDMIRKTREGIEAGAPDPIRVRRLLVEFVRRARAPGLRTQLGAYSHTPDVMEFVAGRIDAFLSGGESDLMKAFGLTKKRRGPKLSADARRRQEIGAAEVLELITKGEKLEVACRIVAQKHGASSRTVSDWYSEHHAKAKKTTPTEPTPAECLLLYYRYLLRPVDEAHKASSED